MPSPTDHVRSLRRAIGPVQTLQLLLARAFRSGAPRRVTTRSGSALVVRPLDSDLFVLGQIFGAEDYRLESGLAERLNGLAAAVRASGRAPVVVDGGANVGYSSLYFAAAYPDCTVLAVEADPTTFALLQQNCAGADRILPVQAALWSHEDGVDFGASSDQGAWAHRVEAGAGLTPSVRLQTLLDRIPGAVPILIKLDIEGGEREVCAAAREVLAATPCIIVEPHDFMLPGAGCLTSLVEALAGREIDTLLHGENLVFCDSALRRPAPEAA